VSDRSVQFVLRAVQFLPPPPCFWAKISLWGRLWVLKALFVVLFLRPLVAGPR